MLVLHAIWSQGELHLWGEDARRWSEPTRSAPAGANGAPEPEEGAPHPYAAEHAVLLDALAAHRVDANEAESRTLPLRLPVQAGIPMPSPSIAHAVGHSTSDDLMEPVVEEGPESVESAEPAADAERE